MGNCTTWLNSLIEAEWRIYVNNLDNHNGLLPIQRQVIFWTNAGLL